MTTSDLVGLRIKTVRRQRGLSQAQLAHPELSDSYVSLIESGKRTPTPAVLELLAQKLDCSLSYLVNGVTAEQMEDIELALGYARLALENGEVSEARTRFAELMANNNLTGLASLRQDTEFGLALATEACGDLAGAIAIFERLRDEDVSPDRRVEISIALCRLYMRSDRLTDAVEIGESVLFGVTRPTWSDLIVELGATLLGAYMYRGDLLRARQFAAELLNAADMLGTPRSMVAANWNAAAVAEVTGHGEEALGFAERALAIQSETGQPRNLARMRTAYASLMLKTRLSASVKEARQLLTRAEQELAQSSASLADRAACVSELARGELLDGNYEQALRYARTGVELLAETKAKSLGAELSLMLSRAYGGLGRPDEAAGEIDTVRRWMSSSPNSGRDAGTWYAAAETMEQIGDTDGAVEAYQRALACAGL